MTNMTSVASQDPNRFGILGVDVSIVDLPEAVRTIARWIDQGRREYVCVANVHLVTECQRNPDLKRIHNEAGMVTPDGMPLVWVSHLAGIRQVGRVYGPDLLLKVCEAYRSRGCRHYFYGGAEGVADQLAARLSERFPGLVVAGTCSPPFGEISAAEDEKLIQQINQANPDIVWVGLGAPKQERWMAAHRHRLNAPVLIGVGAAFDFHAGVKRQAPVWMQRHGLEWAFRLATEPRRLWKRYAVTIPLFTWQMAKTYMGAGDRRQNANPQSVGEAR